MDDKNQNNGLTVDNGGVREAPILSSAANGFSNLEAEALSADPNSLPHISENTQRAAPPQSVWRRLLRRADLVLLALIIIGGLILVLTAMTHKTPTNKHANVANQYDTQQISLDGFIANSEGIAFGPSNVLINGSLTLNNGVVITPSVQPNAATAGQMYYDQNTNQLAYYNGTVFVPLSASGAVVQSIGGISGQLTLGGGLSVVGNQLTATQAAGVSSFGGRTGAITVGGGLNLVGNSLQNTGVLNVLAGTDIAVSNDGNGNVTVSNVGAGTGTVTSGGGTTGALPLFTSSQNIEDSLITQSGTMITITGDLNVVTGGLSLGNALTVSNGGTGATSLAANGVVIASGTAPLTSVVAGAAGLCFVSTAGAPTFAACPSASGVTSLNGLTGALSVANASAAGSTITIDNASTAAKGIASFNPTNFTAVAGAVNTVQDINTTAAPTFGRLTITSSQNTNPMLVVNNTDVTGTGSLLDLRQNGSSKFSVQPNGNTAVVGTINGQTISNTANFTGTLGVAGVTTLSGVLNANGGSINSAGALNITPGGTLTVGASGQTLALQGNTSSSFAVVNGGNTTTVSFQAPTANVTYRYATAAAGSYDVCTTAGNCVGAGGGVTTPGGTTNRLSKFTGASTVGDSSITDNGTLVTTTANIAIQGGTATVGVANSQTGSLTLAYGSANFTGTVTQGALTANRTYILPDFDGTVCLSSGNCLGGGGGGANTALSNLSSVAINTSLLPGATTIDLGSASAPFRNLYIAGSSLTPGTNNFQITGTATAPRTITLPDSSGTVCLNNSTNCGFLTGAGTAFVQNGNTLGVAANLGTNDGFDLNLRTSGTTRLSVASGGDVTFSNNVLINGGQLGSTGALAINPAGSLTAGTSSQGLTLQGNATTKVTATDSGNTTTVSFQVPTANVTYRFATTTTGSYDVCTTAGNCVGTGGGVSTGGGTVGTIAVFTGAQTIGNSLLSQSGGTVGVNGNLNLTAGNQYQINSTQISSGNLSNDANLAKLNASQTFTGNTVAFKNAGDSTNAFNIQNAGGNRIFTVDTTGGQAVLGLASTLDGKLVFNNVSNANTITIVPGTPTAPRTLTLPNASGIICTDSGNCAGAGATLQTGYNFSTGGTTPKIKVDSTLLGVDIQDADSSINANLFNVRASNGGGGGLGSVLFGVGNTGQITVQNSANSTTAVNVLTQGGTRVLTVNTTNGTVILGQGGTLAGSLIFHNATNANGGTVQTGVLGQPTTFILPDPGAGSATVCLNTGNCLGGGGGGANSALSNLSGVAINTTLLPGAAGTVNLGSGTLPFGDVYLAGTSSTPGTNNFKITGVSTGGLRTITLPDASGIVCLQSSAACGFATGTGAAFVQGGNTFGTTATLGTNDGNDLVLRRNSATKLTVGANDLTLASNIDLLMQGATAYLSNPQGQTSAEAFGLNASVSGASAVAVGNGATAAVNGTALGAGAISIGHGVSIGSAAGVSSGAFGGPVSVGENANADAWGVAIGQNSSNNGNNSVAIGNAAHSEQDAIAIGVGANAMLNGVALGYGAITGGNNRIVLGHNAVATADNQMVIGSTSTYIDHTIIGNGVTNATPIGFTLQGTSGNGSNIAGASVTFTGGQSTGSANGGSLNFQISMPGSAGSGLNGLSTVAILSGANGSALFKNAANSTSAFRVQNSTSVNVFTVDTSTPLVRIQGTGTNGGGGQLYFGNDANSYIRESGAGDSDILEYQARVQHDFYTNGGQLVAEFSQNGLTTVHSTNDSFGGLLVTQSNNNPVLFVSPAGSEGSVNVGYNADGAATLFVLDNDATSDPTGVNGSMYYNISTNKFRCYQAGTWSDCISASGGFVSLQNAYTNSTGGSTSEIITDATRGALDIQDRSTSNGGTIAANLLNVRATAATDATAGALMLSVGNTGAVLLQNSVNSANALQVKNALGTATAFDVDTTNTRIGIGTAAPARTLDIATSDSNTTAPALRLLQGGSGDATVELKNSVSAFFAGVDTSDSSLFKISSSNASGATSKFGYTASTWNNTYDNGNNNMISATKVTSGGSAGTLNSISVYVGKLGGAGQMQVALYTNKTTGCVGGHTNCPNTLVASGATYNLTQFSWNTIPLSAAVSASTIYWLAFNVDSGSTQYGVASGLGSDETAYYQNNPGTTTFGSWPASVTTADSEGGTPYRIYATYTTTTTDSFASNLFSLSADGAATFKNTTDSNQAFQVKNSSNSSVLTVDTLNNDSGVNLISDGGFEKGVTGWTIKDSGNGPDQRTDQHHSGHAALYVEGGNAVGGGGVKYDITLTDALEYIATFYVKESTTDSPATTIEAGYNNGSSNTACTQNTNIANSLGWTRIECTIKTPGSHSGTPHFYIRRTDQNISDLFIDDVFLSSDYSSLSMDSMRNGGVDIQGVIQSDLRVQGSVNSTSAFTIQNQYANDILNVDTTDPNNLVLNPSFEKDLTSGLSVFDTWNATGAGTTISRDTSQAYIGTASLKIVTASTANAGATYPTKNTYPTQLAISSNYTLSWYAKLSSGTFTDIKAGYARDGSTWIDCIPSSQAVAIGGWTRFSCTFATNGTAPNASAAIRFIQTATGTARTFWIDGVRLEKGSVANAYGNSSISLDGNITSALSLHNTSDSTTAFLIQNAAGSNIFDVDTLNTTITLGNSGNTLTLSASGGLVAAGNARHTKTILLTPEYAGAVLDAQSDATCSAAFSGTMTSAYDNTNRMNNYNWTAALGSAQCYDVVVQVPIPNDFSAWSGNPDIEMQKDSTGTAAYALQITPTSGNDANYSPAGAYVTMGSLTTSWTNIATSPLSGTYTAGTYMTVKVRLTSTSGANVKLGNIKLVYLSSF